MPFNRWFIHKMGQRTGIRSAARVYITCLRLAVQDTMKPTESKALTEDMIREALHTSESIRTYLQDQKDILSVCCGETGKHNNKQYKHETARLQESTRVY